MLRCHVRSDECGKMSKSHPSLPKPTFPLGEHTLTTTSFHQLIHSVIVTGFSRSCIAYPAFHSVAKLRFAGVMLVDNGKRESQQLAFVPAGGPPSPRESTITDFSNNSFQT